MRRLLLLALLFVPACQRQGEPPAPPKQQRAGAQPAQVSQPTPRQVEPAAADDDAAGAADLLRRYYALIEADRYEDAWKMRGGDRGIDEAQFAAHFRAYESYHSQIGAPSLPAASDGWLYVEVPVMTTGRFLGGKPFGSAGSVTLRRPAAGTKAPPGGPGWRIYTG